MQSIIPLPAWLIVLLCALMLMPAHAAPPKKEAPAPAPPPPVPLNIKVKREGKTEIPLTIYGRANEPLKYVIRTPPVRGKISDPRPTSAEISTVVYEPPADLAITTDRFFYAVQSVAGVSAAVEVVITITDQPPVLIIPDTVDFSTVQTGETSTKLLEISNHGGGLAVGEVIVEAPWRIDGKTGYRLRAGDIAIYKLIFAPTTGGTFDKVARYTSDTTGSTSLRGIGATSVTANPAEIILRQVAGDAVRIGTLELTNQTDEPRNLELKSDDRLKIPAQVSLPAREKLSIPVQTAASDLFALRTDIHITASGVDLRVPVRAAVPGAVLRAVQPAIAFGRVPLQPATSVRFELENIGGEPGEIKWKVAPPFRTRQNSVLLLPGERRAFDLEINAEAPGLYHAWLQCNAGPQSFDIPVDAEIAGAPATPPKAAPRTLPKTARATPPPDQAESPASREVADSIQNPAVASDWLSDRTLPEGVKVTTLTPTTATVEWPVSLSPATRFRVELRQMSHSPDGSLKVTWLELAGIEVKKLGASYVAALRDLAPAQPWTVRVLPRNADGVFESRLFAVDFKTPRKQSHMPKISPLPGLLTALGLLLGWQLVSWWRARNSPR